MSEYVPEGFIIEKGLGPEQTQTVIAAVRSHFQGGEQNNIRARKAAEDIRQFAAGELAATLPLLVGISQSPHEIPGLQEYFAPDGADNLPRPVLESWARLHAAVIDVEDFVIECLTPHLRSRMEREDTGSLEDGGREAIIGRGVSFLLAQLIERAHRPRPSEEASPPRVTLEELHPPGIQDMRLMALEPTTLALVKGAIVDSKLCDYRVRDPYEEAADRMRRRGVPEKYISLLLNLVEQELSLPSV